MSLKFKTLFSVVLGLGALVVGAQSALAQSSIDAREKALGREFALGDFAVNNTWQAGPSGASIYGDASDRAAVVTSMIDARQNALGRDFQLGDFAVNNTWQSGPSGASIYGDASDRAVVATTDEPQWLKALQARSEGLNRIHRLGEYAATPSVSTESPYQRAERLRGEALNRQYGLGEYASPMVDSHNRVDFGTPAPAVPTVSSGSEIQWPELGIGFGVGMVFLLGLILVIRNSRTPPLAHG